MERGGNIHINVRFTTEANRLVRSDRFGLVQRGTLSTRVCAALEAVDLETIDLAAGAGETTAAMTGVCLPSGLFDRLKTSAESRKCSRNRLVNSAIVQHLRSL